MQDRHPVLKRRERLEVVWQLQTLEGNLPVCRARQRNAFRQRARFLEAIVKREEYHSFRRRDFAVRSRGHFLQQRGEQEPSGAE